MSKLKKVTYCQSCGQSNPWVMEAKSSLLQKPKFCSSCGANLATGRKPAQATSEKVEIKEDEDISIPSNIPPLELDMKASYFPKRDSQPLGNLVKPVPDTGEEDT